MRFIPLVLLLVAGCTYRGTSIPPIDGKRAYFIDCTGVNTSWQMCYVDAQHYCPSGYDIVSKDGSGPNVKGNSNVTVTQSAGNFDRGMTITCK